MTNTDGMYSRIADDLMCNSLSVIKAPPDLLGHIQKLFEDGRSFFEQAEASKLAFARPDLIEGFRPRGSEVDNRTGRPDLSESYSVWFRNLTNPAMVEWRGRNMFHDAMSESLTEFAEFVEAILLAVRARIENAGPSPSRRIDIRHISYLQMNYSRPAPERRQLLSDPHEDGHILTIIKPGGPGLMICPGELIEPPTAACPAGVFEANGEYKSIDLDEDEILLVPSVPTYYLTGGLIKPLFHQVARSDLQTRQSLMFFVNPTPGTPLEAWGAASCNEGIDLHSLIDLLSAQYGLPAVSQVRASL